MSTPGAPAAAAWPEQVRAVYVLCHPIHEKARWSRLLPHLLQRGIPQDRIRVCAPTWGTELTPQEIFNWYDPFLKRGSLPSFTFKSAGLTRGEISLGINFCVAVADAVKRAEEGVILVFESDIWLRPDFVPRLRALLADADTMSVADGKPWDFISLGEGVGTRPPGAHPSYFAPSKAYAPPHRWVFRCTDSMAFTTGYLKRLMKTMRPFKEIIDWEQNYQMAIHGGKALWADPPLAEQGTWHSRLGTWLHA